MSFLPTGMQGQLCNFDSAVTHTHAPTIIHIYIVAGDPPHWIPNAIENGVACIPNPGSFNRRLVLQFHCLGR